MHNNDVTPARALAAKFNIATLILTYRCPLACRMCFFESNPKRTEMLDERVARQLIDEAASFGIPHIGFAGGEPILRLDFLCDLIRQCRRNGLEPIVISSGYWGRSERAAVQTVEQLRAAGLERIQLSLDDDHLEFIEIEDFARALAACKAAGFRDIKVVGTSRGNKANFRDLVLYVENVLHVSTAGMDLIDRYRISHGEFSSDQTEHSLDYLEQQVGRPSCLTELMIDVNADVYPCCQNFIGRVGNMSVATLEQIFTRLSEHDVYQEFAEIGPINYARKLDRTCGTRFASQKYGSWCEVCSRVFGTAGLEDSLCEPVSKRSSIARFSRPLPWPARAVRSNHPEDMKHIGVESS